MPRPSLLWMVFSVAMASFSGCAGGDPEPTTFAELAEASLARIEGQLRVPGLSEGVEILRDEWGVPHIYAQNRRDLFFAQGFVQAQDRLWQMDMWRRVNEGRLSEILGAEAFEHDRLARLIQYRGSWDAEFQSYHPEGAEIFQAFSDGVNAYIASIGERLPVEYRLTGLRPLPWTPQASTGRVATALPLGGARQELILARRIAAEGRARVEAEERVGRPAWVPLHLPEGVDYARIPQAAVDALGHFRDEFPRPPLLPQFQGWQDAVASANLGAVETSPGSNNWAVRGNLTASGRVLVANDPHRGVTNPSLRYLVHIEAPGYSVIGSTEPGIPGVAIGHNGSVGWGLTIVGTDQADVFVETLNPENLDQALWEGEWYDLTVVEDTIPIRGEVPRVVQHRFSRHGPIFYVDEENALAYAVRSTANEPGSAGYLGALRLAETSNCREFVDALAYYHAPSENMVCGDAEGNISWLAAALTPRRTGGGFGRLPVPGTGGYGWDGFLSHTELPQEFNPARGWVGTANHEIQPPGFVPPIMFLRGPFSRWDRLQAMFSDVYNLTADDFERMQHDILHPWFEADRSSFQGWTASDPTVEWARQTLADWDGRFDKALPAPALYNRWTTVAATERRQRPEAALAAAVAWLEENQGPDRTTWRWGRIHRSEFPHTLVSAYDLPTVERSGGGGTIAATGATFREIIDFADLDNSRATNTPGQSMQPGSPFYGNLLPIWGAETYFPLLYTRSRVEERTTHRLELRP
jgi:penicillin G amidase